jgi:glycosyltransferase involved in cell wall biosynthesis
MKILWLNWKDRENPEAGGAEVVNEELAKRLVVDGHEVTFLTSGFSGGSKEQTKNGFKIIRVGNKWSVYLKAFQYYKKHLNDWPDLVIDEVNTVPFFAKFYVKQRNILFVHQLCREIWFYQMFFPLNIIGYLIEPIYLYLLSDRKVITVSESTKKDLMRFGFKEKNISIISEGIELDPVSSLTDIEKFEKPTILSLGSVRPMKRTDQILKAFEILKNEIPNAELIIAGSIDGKYGERLIDSIKKSPHVSSIRYTGKVPSEEKIELLQKSHILVVTSVKEGWGLVVTEANSQGTPAVVYNVDGLRDSVRDGVTGLITDINTPQNLSQKIVNLLKSKEEYARIQRNAWEWSKEINFDEGYKQFLNNIK